MTKQVTSLSLRVQHLEEENLRLRDLQGDD